MEERRQHPRFDPDTEIPGYFEVKSEVRGHFQNRERFVIKNVSLGGFNLLSNFLPTIGLEYPIYIEYGDGQQEFRVSISQSSIISLAGIDSQYLSRDIVYSIGCEIDRLTEDQKQTVMRIISRECRE